MVCVITWCCVFGLATLRRRSADVMTWFGFLIALQTLIYFLMFGLRVFEGADGRLYGILRLQARMWNGQA